MTKRFWKSLTVLCAATGFISAALLDAADLYAQSPGNFSARVTLALCPESAYIPVTFDVRYKVGSSSEEHIAQILSQSVDTASKTGTFTLSLPGTAGTQQIHVYAFCRNASGYSKASNSVDISYCDALALRDTDGDGLTDAQEDTNCSGTFDSGDASNFQSADTDGDGVPDGTEVREGTNPLDPLSTSHPVILAGGVFDPNGDNESNPVFWRPQTGVWHIKRNLTAGDTAEDSISFGQSGDRPFVYNPRHANSDVGVIRTESGHFRWLFHGTGFVKSDHSAVTDLSFGVPNDQIVLGPWQETTTTNPAVAHLADGKWTYQIYQMDGTIRSAEYGRSGDTPVPADYDGDGIFDAAFFRPSEGKLYVQESASGLEKTYAFGPSVFEAMLPGDVTGDGIGDVTFWNPQSSTFSSMTSDHGFDAAAATAKDPLHYQETQIGNSATDTPLAWFASGGRILYTVINHRSGTRAYRALNNPSAPLTTLTWGSSGDYLR